MSHEVESMMWTKDVPWHGLGTYCGDEPILSDEAIEKAGLNWTVVKLPAEARLPVGDRLKTVRSTEHFLTVREEDGAVLGAVRSRYQPIQNSEAFRFMDAVAGPGGMMRYHTAGSLSGGSRIWLLGELLNLVVEPIKGDATQPYILLMNGHDGSMAFRAMTTSVRVVCQNTLNLAIAANKNYGGRSFTVRHTGDVLQKREEAQQVLGIATKHVERFKEAADVLAKKQLGTKLWGEFLDSLVPLYDEEEEKSNARRERVRAELTSAWESGPGTDIPGVSGTAWNALQAVTFYTTHRKGVLVSADTQKRREKRLASAWSGSGNDMNQEAMEWLLNA